MNASPKQNTLFFDKNEITLTFDEYIKLEDLSKQLIISPPLESDKYDVEPKTTISKKIVIELLDSLAPETTYTFNFGESVVDNNEGNVLPFLAIHFPPAAPSTRSPCAVKYWTPLMPKLTPIFPYSYILWTAPILTPQCTNKLPCMFQVPWILPSIAFKI